MAQLTLTCSCGHELGPAEANGEHDGRFECECGAFYVYSVTTLKKPR